MNRNEEEGGSAVPRRNLTDADVEALAEKIVSKGEATIMRRFYSNLGKGVWELVWRALVVALMGLAAYGMMTGHRNG